VETEQKKEGITPYRVVPSHILQLLGLIKMPGERKHFMLFFFFFQFEVVAWYHCDGLRTGRRKLIIKNLLKLFLQLFGRRLICVFLS
jgi:hypothetical protein